MCELCGRVCVCARVCARERVIAFKNKSYVLFNLQISMYSVYAPIALKINCGYARTAIRELTPERAIWTSHRYMQTKQRI